MQISVIESNLKCGVCVCVCVHMRNAQRHICCRRSWRCIYAFIAPLQEEHDPIRWLSHDNYKHKPIVCCCSLTIRFIDIIYVALLGMAVKPNSRCICIKSQFHKGSQILFSYSFPGMGDFYHHLIMSIMNNCSTSRSFREQQTILPLSFIILTNGWERTINHVDKIFP